MANDTAKRSLLDQLTAAATTPDPSVPPALAGAVSDPIPLASAPATVPGSTANLETTAASPDTMDTRVAAAQQTQKTDDDAKASQDDKNHPGFLKTLARMAGGAVGFDAPNSSPQASLGARIGGVLGRVGNGLAVAAGTPEQKQIGEENSQLPLKMAQLNNEAQYRAGILGNSANKNNITENKNVADEALKQQNIDSAYLKQNMVPDELRPGMHRPATADETLANPYLQQNTEMRQAATNLKASQSQLAQARQQALTNPNSLTQQNFLKSLEEKERIAQAQLAIAGRHLQLADQTQARQNQEFQYNWGQAVTGTPGVTAQNPPAPNQTTGSVGGLNLGNAPDMMMVNPATGLPIPQKMLSALKPTPQEQSRATFASSAIHSVDKIQQLVEQAKAQVGPFSGRTAELMAKAGLGDQFNQELQNYIRFTQSAATAAHTGRFSVPILDKMDKMIGPEMNPDQLTGAIGSIKGQMAQYADAGWKPTVWEYRSWLGGAGSTPSGKKAPNAPSTPQGNPEGVMYQFPDGTHRMVSPDKAARAEALGAKKAQ